MNREEIDRILAEYIPAAISEGFSAIWTEVESRLRIWAESYVKFQNEILPSELEQARQKKEALERQREQLWEERARARYVLRDGHTTFNYWLELIAWCALVLAEVVYFPFIYRDIYKLPLYTGIGFGVVFLGISMAAKNFYADLGEQGKRLFSKILYATAAINLPIFVICLVTARVLGLMYQRQLKTLSLSGSLTTGDPLVWWQWSSFIGLWILSASIACLLAIHLPRFRHPETRIQRIEEDLQKTEEELKPATDAYTALLRKTKKAGSLVEDCVLYGKNKLRTLVNYEKEDEMRFQKRHQHILPLAGSPNSRNGKSVVAHLGAIGIAVATLFADSHVAAADSNVFFIQDMTCPSEAVEREFQTFGNAVLEIPAGMVTLFGSDGKEYIHGTIEETYESEQDDHRQVIIGQARAFYQKLQEQPIHIRDYATALSDILPRMSDNSILIIQGKPLYRLDPVDWEGRVPTISWAFHADSPFGEHALTPASVKFRAAMVFSPGDFVSPNHRAAIQHFWNVLIARLNGELVLFTTDAGAVASLISGGKVPSAIPQPDITRMSDKEKYGTLKLEGATVLGVQNP